MLVAGMADMYTYSPLSPDKKTIRLLRLTPGSPSKDLDFEVAVRPLEEAPRYNALSYCWGSGNREESILCNGKGLLITKVLAEALKQVFVLDRNGTEWIWVDQICVNQVDILERGSQVNMMRDIYKSSEGTIIWLGPSTSGILPMMGLVEALSSLHDKDIGRDGVRQRRPYTLDEYNATNLPQPQDPSWSALGNVLSRPWFARCWVIQEATLSKVMPQMLCGSHLLSWEKTLSAAAWLETMCYECTPLSFMVAPLALRSLRLLDRLRRTGLPWDLTTMLNMSAYFKCSVPQDHIYSLVGLAGEAEEPELPETLQANYQKSIADTFRDVTRYIIQSTGNLALLTLIRYHPDWDKHPSWVVDFTRDLEWERISYFAPYTHPKGWQSVKEYSNSAAGGSLVEVQASGSDDTLALRGFRIDAITAVCEEMSGPSLKSFGPEILRLLKAASGHIGARYTTIDTLARAIMVTLSADWNLSHQKRVRDLEISDFWAYVGCAYQKCVATDQAGLPLAYDGPWVKPSLESRANRNVYPLCLDAAHRRKLFFTEHLYVGIGPNMMEENDLLCILYGAATPMVLRPIGDGYQYRFIGECYVYDLMSGEAMQDSNHGKYITETFQLV